MKKIIALSLLSLLCCVAGFADGKKDRKAKAIKELLDTRNFVFVAKTVVPMSMRNRKLSAGYDLRVAKDTIIAYMPYYGRAYSKRKTTSDVGSIVFTGYEFEYTVEDARKGWNVIIITKDTEYEYKLNLYVSENGSANLQITDNCREPIIFNGNVQWKPEKMR